MKSAPFLFLLTAAIIDSMHSKIIFDEPISHESVSPSIQQLLQHPYVQVTVSRKSGEINSKFKVIYSKLVISHKNKRSCYEQFEKAYQSIKKKLVDYGSLPDSNSMVDTSIHTRFIQSKRKWEFSRFFIVLLKREDSKRVSSMLKRSKATHLTQKPAIRYLSEKYIAAQAFMLARDELEDYLELNFKGAKIGIRQTQSIEILGDDLIHEEIIEDEIEYEENHLYPRITSHRQLNGHRQNEHPNSIILKQVQMKVRFRVGVLQDADNEDRDTESDNQDDKEEDQQSLQL